MAKFHENGYAFTDEKGHQHVVFGCNEACAALGRMFKKIGHGLDERTKKNEAPPEETIARSDH